MSHRIIRLSEDCGMAIIVSPENGHPKDPSNRYWLLNDNMKEFKTFKEVEFNTVLRFFGGIADGMGFGLIPDTIFEEVRDAEKWVLENKTKFYEERYKKFYDDPEYQEGLKEFLEEI